MVPGLGRVLRHAAMMRRSGAAAPGRALGLASLFALAACSTRSKAPERRGPSLSIVQGQAANHVARGGLPPEAIALALGGLPPEALPRLRAHLADSTDSALRRADPELFDLDDVAPADSLRQALPDLPALTAAANLLGSPWEGPGISVVLGPLCEKAAARCTPLFASAAAPEDAQDAQDALIKRGRALAWALGKAALLRVAASSRQSLLHALWEAQPRPSGTVAMVFGATRGKLDPAELELLHRQAHRVLADLARDAPQRPLLDALEAVRGDWELPILLDADELLVIPRLSALARLQDFVSDVQRAGTFEWVARPGPRGM
jgi:hypothetical protein